jgi:uncharacterized protein YqjF (DUF2071 family)
MLSLKNHPFAVETKFNSSVVLTYAINKEELQELIPECLSLDTFEDKYAFIAIALVDTKNLRPKGFPTLLGNDFFLIGCRIFVRYTTNDGKRLRGLYILKSETNKNKMSVLGNIFTHYKYTTTDIDFKKNENKISIVSKKSDLEIEVNLDSNKANLPENSPFKDWKEARRFAGPLPFTFSYNKEKKEVLIIEGVRENWIPKPIEITKHKVGFIDQFNFKNVHLANAFMIENIPYYWKKGKTEIWKK